MPRNTSGVYTLPAGNPVVPGTVIDAAWANSTLEDLANEVTNSLSRTGAGGMLAPFRIADGTITTPGLSYLNETNTGLYRSGAGSTWMAVLGVNIAQFSTVGFTIPAGKALTAQGNASVGGTLAVTGATTLASSLAVTGAITAAGGVVGNVTGNVTAASGSSTFNNITISGSLDMDAGSSATITGLSTPTNASDAANKGYVDSVLGGKLSLTGGTMTGAIAMSNTKITGLATPTADTDAATKAYVDSTAQGLDVKGSCRVATTANITLSGTQSIDGVAVVVGNRVLVKNQSTATQNGIYVVASGAWTRPPDANTCAELAGAFTFIENGVTNYNSGWVCQTDPDGIIGIQPIEWIQFSGAGQINAGTGMTKSGNTLNVNTASSSRIVVNTDDIDLATTGVTANTYKSVTVDAYGRVTGGSNPNTLSGYGITDAYTTSQVDTLVNAKLSLTGGTMSGAIAMGTNKITGLGDPTNAQDAATKNYIDTIFGSTTTAAASAAAAATSASNAASSASAAASSATAAAGSATSAASSYTTFNNQYLGSKASDPSVNNTGGALVAGNLYYNTTVNEMRVYSGSAWLAAYIPATGYLALTGGTMTGAIAMSNNKITGLGAPSVSTDAATKGYIDTSLGSYLTSATAASTYQTQAGMSSYLTTAAAASTYQTQAGMSSYLTTASAASTYLALTGGTLTGNLNFNATGLRITGDMTNTPTNGRLMFVTSIANSATNVGAIPSGTSNQTAFEIYNATDTTNAAFGRFNINATQVSIRSAINGTGTYLPLTLWTGGSERVRVNETTGNFLIGTTTDDATNKLQVTGGTALTGALSVTGAVTLSGGTANGVTYLNGSKVLTSGSALTFDGASFGIGTNSPAEKLLAYSASGNSKLRTDSGANQVYMGWDGADGIAETATNGSWRVRVGGSFSEQMRLTSTGLGIGTSSPAAKLDVKGGEIQWGASSSLGALSYTGGYPLIGSIGALPLAFYTNGAERARIDSSGNLLVGVTSSASWSSGGVMVSANYDRTLSSAVVIGHVSGSVSGDRYMNFGYNGSAIGSITQNGTTAVAYNTSSDYRLKNTIAPMTGALAKVALLKPCTYKWNADGFDGEGFIAHELAEVVPQCVTGEKDAVDEDGNPKYQGIDTSFLVATLTAAIQELKAEFDAYKASHP